MMYARRWAARLALLVVGMGFLAAGGTAADSKDSVLPDSDYRKLVDYEYKVLQEAFKDLKAGSDKKAHREQVRKARAAAAMIATCAQLNLEGAEGQQRATVRDAALAVADALGKDKVAEAEKKAEGLLDLKADPKAKTAPVKIFDAHLDLEELMSQFRQKAQGGLGIEKMLLDMGTNKKKTIPPAQMSDQLLVTCYQMAVIAELTKEHTPKKNPKNWGVLTADFKKYSLELADAIKAKEKDGKAAFATLNKLNSSCTQCHDEYRK